MVKLWLLSVVSALLIVQLALPIEAADLAEALNHNIREQLKGYENFLAEDDGTHKDDLTKLIELTESALVIADADEKNAIIKGIPEKFSAEFNKYISTKLEEFHVNDNIKESIQFYKSLSKNAEHKAEVEQTIAKLEEILKNTDLKQKEEQFFGLDKAFTPEFQQFLRDNALPAVNRSLQKTEEFLETLLREPDVQFVTEITGLIEQTRAALGDITIEEKQTALQKVTNPQPQELFEYLQKKFIELS